MTKHFFVFLVSLLVVSPGQGVATEVQYQPKAQKVVDGVYAIIGPLGQRSAANAGLNANYGFIITSEGVLLIDSGASAHAARLLERAVLEVTDKPIRWVLNTGSQDHRWLGNDYFVSRGAQIHALDGTMKTQKALAGTMLDNMRRFVGEQMQGTRPAHPSNVHPTPEVSLSLGGVKLLWIETSAHYPGDTMIHLPEKSVTFTGDLVYVERLLGVLPQSNVRKAHAAFERLRSLSPKLVVPGHGRVTDIAQAQRETGDYYRFLISNVGAAARNLDSLEETLMKFADAPAFAHLMNFSDWHRTNMSRVFVDFEANP
jgi:glyoxylase-like metal-dependent hydrolase (beta-lactamase superfamily II)